MGFILMLRLIRVSGREMKEYTVSWDGWDGSFELLLRILPISFLTFFTKKQELPVPPVPFGVKPPQNAKSKGKYEPYGDGEGWFRDL